MTGLETFMWRSAASWPELVRVAGGIVTLWNGVTPFVVNHDQRERIWTVRHASSALPFLVLNQDSLRGSAPRIGNPLAMLLLLGIARQRPDYMEISFSNGQKIDAAKFELQDLTALLPHATHAAHRKLAEIALAAADRTAPSGAVATTHSNKE